MTLNEYQKLAMRTCCIPYDNKKDMLRHAVFGLCSEAGEIAELVEKSRPWMLIDMLHFKKELGDCCWMIAEAATALDIEMDNLFVNPTMSYFSNDIVAAVFNIQSKAGVVAGLLQKEYQGHEFNTTSASLALGECLATIGRVCEMGGFSLREVMQLNIDKLRARFPEGFEVDKSLHRADGDI
jgi:NTP pyrophosphatase (non-canonical NTP hydrolase)